MEEHEDLEQLEEKLSSAEDDEFVSPPDIVAFNESRSCADIYRMYEKKQLNIQPDFQRNFIWGAPAQTRFIDSLIKQLPIPSICISLDYKTEKRIVIDGLQRISTIVQFFSKDDWRLSRLKDIDARISNRTVAEIKASHHNLFERVENVTLPITVLRCDYSNQNHMDYLFTIFHRLNTGGSRLNNQEIRNCIYSGNFNDLLKKVTDIVLWKRIFGDPSRRDRFESEEILLRTYAFVERLDDYSGNLARFLNHYMEDNRDLSPEKLELFETNIQKALEIIDEKIDDKATILAFGRTMKEGLLVGISMNLERLSEINSHDVTAKFHAFVNDPEFNEANIQQSLAVRDKVQSRLRRSIEIFGA